MRKVIDCTLTIAGEEEEVIQAATEHSVSVRGEVDTPEFRATLRTLLKDEVPQHA
ncbi:DUF1059 domain-containing protein [Streptomyces sp. MS1.HAVA.3]|uniref:DUF1059 domain-containing protein n=1 Tax=Streptomyces caledonius TaxID=3134107 RepID=A0ABU8U9F6_9ACTN